ncbi:MAG: acetyl-CoA C-acyltransferase, partial [Gemmatimonadales bacterium]
MRDAVIVDAVRTPVGRHGGVLASVRPDDLAAVPIKALLERTAMDSALIDDVILGCANGAGEDNRNVARMALLLAGLPVEVPGQTVNRLCGSGLQAVISAAHAIKSGEGDCFIAGGVESMTRAPYVQLKSGEPWNRATPAVADTTVGWRFTNPLMPKDWTISLGETAEKVAERFKVSREDQDRFAAESQKRAACALRDGAFDDELVPVMFGTGKLQVMVAKDEHPRPDVTVDSLAKLKPAFKQGGTVTAGSSSGINDGAAALLVMDSALAKQRGYQPLARVVASAVAGVAPDVMGIGPVPAV